MADWTTVPKAPEDTAEFNSALALLDRINQLEYAIEDSLIGWKLQSCFALLESYENELCFSFKDSEQKQVDDLKKEIMEYFNKYPSMGKTIRVLGSNQRTILNSNITPIVREKLIQLDKLLRKLKYIHGMGMPKRGEGKLF